MKVRAVLVVMYFQTYSLELDLALEEEAVVVMEAVLISWHDLAWALYPVLGAMEVDLRHL